MSNYTKQKQCKTFVCLPNNPALIDKLALHESAIKSRTSSWSAINLRKRDLDEL